MTSIMVPHELPFQSQAFRARQECDHHQQAAFGNVHIVQGEEGSPPGAPAYLLSAEGREKVQMALRGLLLKPAAIDVILVMGATPKEQQLSPSRLLVRICPELPALVLNDEGPVTQHTESVLKGYRCLIDGKTS